MPRTYALKYTCTSETLYNSRVRDSKIRNQNASNLGTVSIRTVPALGTVHQSEIPGPKSHLLHLLPPKLMGPGAARPDLRAICAHGDRLLRSAQNRPTKQESLFFFSFCLSILRCCGFCHVAAFTGLVNRHHGQYFATLDSFTTSTLPTLGMQVPAY